jgi:bacteriorhodopsin
MISGTSPIGSGTDAVLWITALIMIIGSLIFTFRSFTARAEVKHYFYASALIPLIAATLYTLMASGYGTLNQNGHLFFFGRYIDWVFTTPLLLLDLGLVALPKNFPGRLSLIATMMGADVYMIVTGFVATAIRSDFRWAFYGASCAGFLAVLYFILVRLTPEAARRRDDVRQLYRMLSMTLIVLWFCYPIVWVLGSEGFGVISVLAETILYAILDILAKVGYGFILLSRPATLAGADETPASISKVAAQA